MFLFAVLIVCIMDKTLSDYLLSFQKLKRASHPRLGKAPHKPVLLLSVLQLIRDGVIHSNRIFITPELVIAFKSNWELLVTSGHVATFSLPFFHLGSEPFWRVVFTPGHGGGVSSISSFAMLKRVVAYAEIDIELFRLMVVPVRKGKFFLGGVVERGHGADVKDRSAGVDFKIKRGYYTVHTWPSFVVIHNRYTHIATYRLVKLKSH